MSLYASALRMSPPSLLPCLRGALYRLPLVLERILLSPLTREALLGVVPPFLRADMTNLVNAKMALVFPCKALSFLWG